jgi:serine/threonine protein kinase
MPLLTAKERINTEVGGRYRIKRIIGEGAFGAVFCAEHLLTSREVALKILHAHLVQTEQIATRFLLEAQTMAKIRHPGMCQVLDAGREPDGTIFLVLELLEGETLEESLERRGRLPKADSLRIAVEVLDALCAAHAREIVHRDIKPANIYLHLEPDGTVRAKLLDFGIAQVAPKGGHKITEAGMILGTPEYMPPEQALGKQIGPVSDVWAVGIVLYEMLSGMVPWSGDSAASVLMSVAHNPLTDVRELQPELSPAIAGIIARALEKEPTARYQSAADMRDALIAVAEAEGLTLPYLQGARTSMVGSGEFKAVRPPAAPVPASPSAQRRGGNIEFELPDNLATPSLALAIDQIKSVAGAGDSLPIPAPPEPVVPKASVRPPPMNAPASSEATRKTGSHSGVAKAVQERARTASRGDLATVPTDGTGKHSPMRPVSSAKAHEPVPIGGSTGPAFKTVEGPRDRTPLAIAGVVGVLLLGGGVYALSSLGEHPQPRIEEDAGTRVVRDLNPVIAPTGDMRFVSQGAIPLPFSLRGDDRLAFARHLVLGPARTDQSARAVGTCAAGSVRLFSSDNGLPSGSADALIACSAYDLAIVGDIDGDGRDEIAAVSQDKNSIHVLSTAVNPARTLRSIPLPMVRGLASNLVEVPGRTLLIAYVEPREGGATELVAVDVRAGTVAWRAQGREPLVRLGIASELGLSVGPDADGDGVRDVVAGATVLVSTTPDRMPELPRCVELISGATGRPVWAQPFCQRRGGAQSVSLGDDLNGDHKGDIAVGTDVTRGTDARVVILSGADSAVLKRIQTPEGPIAQGFGWPVALGGDATGDGIADVAVGTVNASETHVSLVDGSSGLVRASINLEGTPGFI